MLALPLIKSDSSSKSQYIWDSASLEKWGHLWGSCLTRSARPGCPALGWGCSVLSKTRGGQMSGSRVRKGPRRRAPAPLNSQSPHLSEVISTKPGEDNCAAGPHLFGQNAIHSQQPRHSGFEDEERAPCLPGALEFHSVISGRLKCPQVYDAPLLVGEGPHALCSEREKPRPRELPAATPSSWETLGRLSVHLSVMRRMASSLPAPL